MALITRLSRLFTADFHAVLDRIEEPELLLKQALREMEEELSRTRHGVERLQHEHDRLADRHTGAETALGKIDEELDICFQSDEYDLARSITRRKLETTRLADSIASKLRETRQALCDQQQLLKENRARLESLRQKAELLCPDAPQRAAAANDHQSWRAEDGAVTDDEVEVAFLKEKQRRNPS